MKVAIIGTCGVPANYGGFETLVENLLIYKKNQDIDYIVYCSSSSYKHKMKEYKGAKLKYIPFRANGWQALIYDSISLLRAYFSSDVILSLGGNDFILPVLRMFKKKKVINNFDGLDIERDKWGRVARLVMTFTTKITAKYVDICISDNEEIRTFIKEEYGRDSALIEYGGDNAESIKDDDKLFKKYGLKTKEYYFKVARIEPENNIHIVLEAFKQMPNRELVLVGNWDKNSYGKELKQKYSSIFNIKIYDPIYELPELNLLRSNCKVYIHAHSMGGTNPSLVEAMNSNIPIIAYNVIYNISTTENKAFYFEDSNSLIDVISSVDDNQLIECTNNMKEIAERRYLWSIICEKYESIY